MGKDQAVVAGRRVRDFVLRNYDKEKSFIGFIARFFYNMRGMYGTVL